MNNHELKLGKDGRKNFSLPYDVRLQNAVVYGAKGSGKSRFLLPYLANEQAEDAESGATFICNKGNTSWLLVKLFEKYNREVVYLNPRVDAGAKDLIDLNYQTGSELDKQVINFTDAIQNKKIVIIDLELPRTRNDGRKSLINLLYHLQRAMVENTADTPHFVYFDDADDFLPYIHDLLFYGTEFQFGTTLFLQSFNLLEIRSRELTSFLNANCATTIMMSLLSYEDGAYFERRFNGRIANVEGVRGRNMEQLLVESNLNGKGTVTQVAIKFFTERTLLEFEEEVERQQVKAKQAQAPKKMTRSSRRPSAAFESMDAKETVVTGFREVKKINKVFLNESDYFDED